MSAEHEEHRPEDDENVTELEAELEKILREAESTVAELRRELSEQRQRRLQHEEIERLEEHLANSRVRWEEVRDFFQEVLHEVRGQDGDAGGQSGSGGTDGPALPGPDDDGGDPPLSPDPR